MPDHESASIFSPNPDKPYTRWVAHPDGVAYVHDDDNNVYHHNKGWWRTPWRGTESDVRAAGGEPIHKQSRKGTAT